MEKIATRSIILGCGACVRVQQNRVYLCGPERGEDQRVFVDTGWTWARVAQGLADDLREHQYTDSAFIGWTVRGVHTNGPEGDSDHLWVGGSSAFDNTVRDITRLIRLLQTV